MKKTKKAPTHLFFLLFTLLFSFNLIANNANLILDNKDLESLDNFEKIDSGISSINLDNDIINNPDNYTDLAEKLETFNKKLITEIPIKYKDSKQFSIGLYWSDITNLSFLFSEMLLDRYLYKELENYYSNFILESINKNLDTFYPIIKDLNDCLNKKEKIDKDNTEEIEEINLECKAIEENLSEYINNKFNISFSRLFKNIFLKKFIFYFTLTEISHFCKKTILNENDITSLSEAFKQIKNSGIGKYLQQKPIPIFSFIKLLQQYMNIKTQPITTSVSIFTTLISAIQKLLPEADKNTNNKITFAKSIFQKYLNFLNSKTYLLAKEPFVLAFSLKSIDKNLYKPKWINFTKNNTRGLYIILNKYQRLKKTRNNQNKEEIEQTKKELKNFILNGHKMSFLNWMQNKNATLSSINTWTNFILNIPTCCYLGKMVYDFYQEINQDLDN